MPRLFQPWTYQTAMLVTLAVSAGALVGLNGPPLLDSGRYGAPHADSFICYGAMVVDGDTLRCGPERVRLEGIDAPETGGRCRPGRRCVSGDPVASTENLRRLVWAEAPVCRRVDTDVYGRTVARCETSEADLSCAQIEGGFAVRRYGHIWC